MTFQDQLKRITKMNAVCIYKISTELIEEGWSSRADKVKNLISLWCSVGIKENRKFIVARNYRLTNSVLT